MSKLTNNFIKCKLENEYRLHLTGETTCGFYALLNKDLEYIKAAESINGQKEIEILDIHNNEPDYFSFKQEENESI